MAGAAVRLTRLGALLALMVVLHVQTGSAVAKQPSVSPLLEVARPGHSATLLRDGTVLVAGGAGGEASAEVYDPVQGGWHPTGIMTTSRAYHTATLLKDGRVLVTGGAGTASDIGYRASAEIYEPKTEAWKPVAPMALARAFHTATVLADGRVLIAGGQGGGHGPYHREAEIFDPAARSWAPAGVMEIGRSFHTATLLSDGSVLATGGQGVVHDNSLRDATLYRPGTNTWAPVPSLMADARAVHTATRLGDGTVLLVGGTGTRQGDGVGAKILSSAERYDPGAARFLPAAPLPEPRVQHSALLLPSGKVAVIAGGGPGQGRPTDTQLFDPATGTWQPLAALAAAPETGQHTATLLEREPCGQVCGSVLVVGERSVQLWAPPPGEMEGVPTGTGGENASSKFPILTLVLGLGLVVVAAAVSTAVRRTKGGRRVPVRVEPAASQRHASIVTDQTVVPEPTGRGFRRRAARLGSAPTAAKARTEAEEVLAAFDESVAALRAGLGPLAALRRPRLLGKVEEEQGRVERAASKLVDARQALAAGKVADCGRAVSVAQRELSSLGGQLSLALARELGEAVVSREKKSLLEANRQKHAAAEASHQQALKATTRGGALASARVYQALAEGWAIAATVLGGQSRPAARRKVSGQGAEVRIVSADELETFADVGGLEDAKERLRRTVGLLLERGADAAESGVVHNGILLYGPPGTGKTLLARALAGEYGLGFLRFSPALIASSFQHEPAKKLREVFAQAAEATPCLLLLDEVDSIGGRRDAMASPDQRELATQLLNSLEEYRDTPGLVIMAATNALDHLDPAFREGRFDSRIAVALPDAEAREEILRVQLSHRASVVNWEDLDLGEVSRRTGGRSGAALAAIANGAAERALAHGGALGQADLLAEIEGRSGQDRAETLQNTITWDDVVLPEPARKRLAEILLLFQRPELGESLGVRAPAGILLHGPPGTGKTTIARALASEVRASFYEQSAADLLSKWVGESEQRVAQLFARARANRPSIIFIDEVDALLKRRSADSVAPWEERVVSQFLGELDGLGSSEGVLLVGSTNRPDIIDDAVRDRRLVAIEVPLPDATGRAALLDCLFRSVRLEPGVDLAALAAGTEGMSGADLKALRDTAAMKALSRAATDGQVATDVMITRSDLATVLGERGIVLAKRRTPAPRSGKGTRPPAASRKRSRQ